MSDMAGKAARVAVERCRKQPRYNPYARPDSIRVRKVTLQTLIDRSSDEVDAWILEIFRVEEEIGRQSVVEK